MAVYNPSLSHAVAIAGNTSGALATVSTGTFFMAGGNNVTLSQNGNSVTFSAANQTNPAFSASGGSSTFQTLGFSNNNGITFTNTNGQVAITHSLQYLSNTSAITANALNTSQSSLFQQTSAMSNYLTTAAQSNHSHNFATTTTNGSQIVVGTANSAGATIGVPAFITTYVAQTNQTVASGNIAGVGTTFNGTNVSGSMTLNSNGLNLALSAGAGGAGETVGVSNIGNTSGTSGTHFTQLILAGGNNITLSMSQGNGGNSVNGTLTISGPNVGFSASGGSSAGVVTFSNSANAVTFSNSNGQVVMSHSLQQLSNTSAITASALNTSQSSLFQQTSAMSNFAGTSTGFTGTNISASMTHNSQGLALQLSVAPGGGGGVAMADGAGDTVTNGTLNFINSNGLTFNIATAANGAHTITGSFDPAGGAAVTFMTWQNRQLGASSSTQFTNGQIWMIPFRVAGGYVSASTIQYIQSLSGTFTSAAAATHGETMRWCIYSANPTNSSVFNTASSGSFTWQFWNSGTSSGSWAYNGVTSSSAGTGVLTQAAGVRMMNIPFGSSLAPGLYMMAFNQSTSSAGYSALLSRYGCVVDSPMPLAMGNGFGSATATSIGYVDAGTYSTTSAGFPSAVNISDVRQHSNLVPYFKIGAM